MMKNHHRATSQLSRTISRMKDKLYKLRKCREDIINICPEGIIQYKMFEIHTKGVTDTFIKVIDDAMRSILDY
ncbi:hypothetical protein FOZ63_021868, partial [Perkinsus olseni]